MAAPKGWEYYFLFSEQGLARVEFSLRAMSESRMEANFTCRLLCWMPDERCDDNGFPLPEEEAVLMMLEQQLSAQLIEAGVKAELVGRLTYLGVCEWVWITTDGAAFRKVAEPWMDDSQHSMEMREENGWEYVDAHLLPDDFLKNQIFDRRRIEACGIPSGTEAVLLHTFTGGQHELDLLKEELTADKFKEVDRSENQLWLARPVALDLREVSKLTWALRSFCGDIGAMYEGWEARAI
jgi:hypothetical protein